MQFLTRLVRLFEEDTRAWLLTPRAAWILVGLPILFVVVMVAMIKLPDLYVWITAEDSLLEWLQFIFVFAASVIFAWSGVRLFQNQRAMLAILYLLAALAAFFVAGEEIAWGQQVFHWQTPEALEAVNSQHETTLHNISSAHSLFIYAIMMIGLYGVLMPLLAAAVWKAKQGSLLRNLLVPPLCLIPAFFMPFAYRFSRLALGVDERFPKLIFAITKFSEVTELCLYFALMVFAWLNLRQIRVTLPSPEGRLVPRDQYNH